MGERESKTGGRGTRVIRERERERREKEGEGQSESER